MRPYQEKRKKAGAGDICDREAMYRALWYVLIALLETMGGVLDPGSRPG